MIEWHNSCKLNNSFPSDFFLGYADALVYLCEDLEFI